MATAANETGCCPRFDPEPWKDQEITWEEKRFVKDRVRSFLHIPLNFGGVMKRQMALIDAADARPDEVIVLADENSLWGCDVYIAVSKDVPGTQPATLSGTYLTKVFEGPYKDAPKWMRQMQQQVESQGRTVKKIYNYYTTCPRCAKHYGKNYVVLLAQV